MQRLRTYFPGHFSSYFALYSYGLFGPLALWRLSILPLVQALERDRVTTATTFVVQHDAVIVFAVTSILQLMILFKLDADNRLFITGPHLGTCRHSNHLLNNTISKLVGCYGKALYKQNSKNPRGTTFTLLLLLVHCILL